MYKNTFDEAFVVFKQFQSCFASHFHTIFNCVEMSRMNVKYLNVYDGFSFPNLQITKTRCYLVIVTVNMIKFVILQMRNYR